jgi:hypothetical protein
MRRALVGPQRRLRSGPFAIAVLACGVCCAGVASPAGAVAAPNTSGRADGAARLASGAEPAIEPQVCSGCKPPLIYEGGPVLSTNTAAGLTVTPIFWEPSGGKYVFPAKYEDILSGYIKNVAAASGTTDNIFSIPTEYYQVANGVKTSITYAIHAGPDLVDTDPFPAESCTPDAGYSYCITDAQLRTELSHVTASQKWATTLANFYPLFFPPGVETKDLDGSNSASGFCGYHRAFGQGADQTVYANVPFEATGCDAGQAPNGDLPADGAVSTLSHELIEAMTDPLDPQYAWSDKAGNEIGDMCAQTYGRPLGSTNPSNPSASEYNQVINGGKYYVQQMFSNLAYGKSGKGCTLSEALAENPRAAGTGAGATTVVSAFSDATPADLPADGTSTSGIEVTAADASGDGVAGDHFHFNVGLQFAEGQDAPSGSEPGGLCGKLSSTEATTDADGNATVTYTASTYNVACWVLATEAEGGRSAVSVIYQGTAQKDSPSLVASFPTSLHAGGSPTTFTVKMGNASSEPVGAARVQFEIFPGTAKSKDVHADQVHLSYSTTGPNGHFAKLALSGSTSDGNVILGDIGPPQGATVPPKSSQTITFHVSLASTVPVSKATPILAFEAYLNQVNSADGSGTTLADTYATDIKVPTAASSNTLTYVLIAIGVLVVVLAIVGTVVWSRRKRQPQSPTPGAVTP